MVSNIVSIINQFIKFILKMIFKLLKLYIGLMFYTNILIMYKLSWKSII